MLYEALKVWQFSQRSELRDKIRESLVFQYAVSDYFELLIDYVNGDKEMSKEELGFYRAFSRFVSGAKIVSKKKSLSRSM